MNTGLRLVVVLMVVALVIMALPSVSVAQEEDVIAANRALALRYAELRMANWPDEESAALSQEGMVTHVWSLGDDIGIEEDRAFMAANAPFALHDCASWASEEFAVLHCYATGKFDQDWAGLTANHAEWGINIVLFFRMADGKITEAWFCYDSLDWFQQLGVIPVGEGTVLEPEPQWVITTEETDASEDEVIAPLIGAADALASHNLDGLADYVAEDFIIHDVMVGDMDLAGYQAYMTANQTGLEDWTVVSSDLSFADGNLVFALDELTGNFSQELNGIPPNGNTISIPILTVFRIEAGKIAEIWSWYDTASFITQLTAPSAE